MTLLERILAKDEPTSDPGPAMALKNYKGFDIFEKSPDDFRLYNRKYNSWEKGHYKGLDSAKYAADEKFEKMISQDKKSLHSYPMLARVLAGTL